MQANICIANISFQPLPFSIYFFVLCLDYNLVGNQANWSDTMYELCIACQYSDFHLLNFVANFFFLNRYLVTELQYATIDLGNGILSVLNNVLITDVSDVINGQYG